MMKDVTKISADAVEYMGMTVTQSEDGGLGVAQESFPGNTKSRGD